MKNTKDEKLKILLTDMLAWFHKFCEENDLTYFILGGTMLGAVRHKGFIPWDDDIDVGMPRSDYEKLAKLMSNKNKGRYILETPDSEDENFCYAFSKLYDSETTLIENTRHPLKRGIYLDVFPLDGVGNSQAESESRAKKIYFYHNLLLLKITGIRKGRSVYKNIGVMIFKYIPINVKKLIDKITKISKEKKYDDCSWIGNLMGAWRLKEVMPKEYLGTPTLYKFENLEIYGPEQADNYLRSLYGDYMTPPPVDKQVTHHDYILLDLEEPYIR